MANESKRTERLKKRGKNVRFLGTGQTGIMLSGSGVPIDAVVADFMVGEIEYVIDSFGDKVDLVIADNVTVKVVQSTIQGVTNQPNTKK